MEDIILFLLRPVWLLIIVAVVLVFSGRRPSAPKPPRAHPLPADDSIILNRLSKAADDPGTQI